MLHNVLLLLCFSFLCRAMCTYTLLSTLKPWDSVLVNLPLTMRFYFSVGSYRFVNTFALKRPQFTINGYGDCQHMGMPTH